MMTTYPVNGSLALKPRAYGNQSFTVIEGGSARVDAQAPSFMAQLHQRCALIMVGLFACVLLAGVYMVLDAPAQAYQAAYESTELQALLLFLQAIPCGLLLSRIRWRVCPQRK